GRLVARGALDHPDPSLARHARARSAGGARGDPLCPGSSEGRLAPPRAGDDPQDTPALARAVQKHAGAVSLTDAQILGALERGRAAMDELKERALQLERRGGTGDVAYGWSCSGALLICA